MTDEYQSTVIAVAVFILVWFAIGYIVAGDEILAPIEYLVEAMSSSPTPASN